MKDAGAANDPHLTSLAGERFDIGSPATYTMLRLPKDEQQPPLLQIMANVSEEPAAPCTLYMKSITLGGEFFKGDSVEVLPLARDEPGSNTAGGITERPFSLVLQSGGISASTPWDRAAQEWGVGGRALGPLVVVRAKQLQESRAERVHHKKVANSSAPVRRFPNPSMMCWLVIMTSGYELDLVKPQCENYVSIWRCDEHIAFSDYETELCNGEVTVPVGDLTSKIASWGSWANSAPFLRVWGMLISDGRFRDHEWTVKVDADSVFYPERLRRRLAEFPTDKALFLHNVRPKFGFLGPIEVLSQQAVVELGKGNDTCAGAIGNTGEDGYLDRCLKLLNVEFQDAFDILDASGSLDSCGKAGVATFHPFKSWDKFSKCMSRGPPMEEGDVFEFTVGSGARIVIQQASHQALNMELHGANGLGATEFGGLLGTGKHAADIEMPTSRCRASRAFDVTNKRMAHHKAGSTATASMRA